MLSKTTKRPGLPRRKGLADPPRRWKVLTRLLENRLIERVGFKEYRDKVRKVYDGPQGAMLVVYSMVSPHATLGERLFRERKFDLRDARNILDVGSGVGQITRHLLRHADPQAELTCLDLSLEMLRRARKRLKSNWPRFVVADLSQLPFASESFDCVTCGYVLEHLPDPRPGLAELSRVMMPGARMLLLATEDNFFGAMTSRLWRCRTYNRRELARICEELNLRWNQELWYTRMHKALHAGGICVELVKV
jgi:ubiquinone/menaquinone biosynthesis C-methylase UbiE